VIALPSFVHTVDDLSRSLPDITAQVGAIPVIVSDVVLAESGLVRAAEQALGTDVVRVPAGEPSSAAVTVLAHDLVGRGCDVVVAVGGGSVLDTVKLAARLVGDPAGLEGRLLGASRFPPGVGVVALPTTAGSGAEVTRTAIVTHAGRKTWAWDERLRPDAAVLAPQLTLGLPLSITVSSGLDAFVHAVEAATGLRSTPPHTALGFEAAALVHAQLPEVVERPDSWEARLAMLEAAAAAGVAIDHCGTGVGHAVGHALASVVPIPHGLAVMLGLRAGLEWTLERAAQAYAGLAQALGCSSVAALPAAFDRLLDSVGFQRELARWERPTAAALADELASIAHEPMCRNNARPIGPGDRVRIAELVMEYWTR